jgi:hypothetical protein
VIAADTWVVVGTIAGVVAALGAIGAVIATIVYGRKTDADARRAVRYERLREVRDMLTRAGIAAGNTRFGDANDLCGRVADLLPQLQGDYPNVLALVETEWEGLETYGDFHDRLTAALREIDEAIRRLGTE